MQRKEADTPSAVEQAWLEATPPGSEVQNISTYYAARFGASTLVEAQGNNDYLLPYQSSSAHVRYVVEVRFDSAQIHFQTHAATM